MRALSPKHTQPRRGIILIVVLVLVVMMSLAGFTFMRRMQTEYEATNISGSLRQAQQTMASAETYLLSIAEQHAGQPDPWNPLLQDARLFSARSIRPVKSERSQKDSGSSRARGSRWNFSVFRGTPSNAPKQERIDDLTRDLEPADGLHFGLSCESGKLHLGRVMYWEKERAGSGVAALMQIPNMTVDAAAGILDWMDNDHDTREFGKELDYYRELDHWYGTRNGLPESLEELLFVRGVTPEKFYGALASQHDQHLMNTAWSEFLTVVSAERNTDRWGFARIDLNDVYPSEYTSGAEAESDDGLSFLPENLLKFILLARLYGIDPLPRTDDGESAAITFTSESDEEVELADVELPDDESLDIAEIGSVSDLIGSTVTLPESEHHPDQGGARVRSPLAPEASEFFEWMKLLEEHVTVSTEDILLGRININQAPEPVLRALLSGDRDAATRIVEQRKMLEHWERESSAWLVTRQILDVNTYRRIFPHITTRGDVYSGEIVVYRKSGGPFIRQKATIDASVSPARLIHRVDLTDRGLPVSISDLKSEASAFDDAKHRITSEFTSR